MPRTSQRSTSPSADDQPTTVPKRQPARTGRAAAGKAAATAGKPANDSAKRATRTRRDDGEQTERRSAEPANEVVDDGVDVNLVVLRGRLAADAEHRTYESGATAMRFLVTIRLAEPRKRIDVIPVTLWDPTRELVRKPPVRGDRIWFTGNVQRRFWEAPDGRRSRVEVVAHQVERVGPDAGGQTA